MISELDYYTAVPWVITYSYLNAAGVRRYTDAGVCTDARTAVTDAQRLHMQLTERSRLAGSEYRAIRGTEYALILKNGRGF